MAGGSSRYCGLRRTSWDEEDGLPLQAEAEKGAVVSLVWPDDFVNRVICGDCLEILPQIPDGAVDAVITDPPYFIPANHYNTRTKFRRTFGDLGILSSFFNKWFEQIERILKPTARLFIFCNGQSYPLFFYLSYFFTKSVRPLIWDKKTSINGFGWRHQHELILYGEMPEANVIPSGDGDILRFSAVPVINRQHPAEKPTDLLSHLIQKTTKTNDIICDPFLGGNSLGFVASQLGRRYIGIEIEPKYCEIARERLKQEILL